MWVAYGLIALAAAVSGLCMGILFSMLLRWDGDDS